MTEEKEIKKEDFCANFFTQTYRGGADTVTPPLIWTGGIPPFIMDKSDRAPRSGANFFSHFFVFFVF